MSGGIDARSRIGDDHTSAMAQVCVAPLFSLDTRLLQDQVVIVDGAPLQRLVDGRSSPNTFYFSAVQGLEQRLVKPIDLRIIGLLDLLDRASVAKGVILSGDVDHTNAVSYDTGPPGSTWWRDTNPLLWRDTLEEDVEATLEGRASPRYAIYPFSGYDLASVVAAFRGADLYLLIDDHSFFDIKPDTLLPNTTGFALYTPSKIDRVVNAGVVNAQHEMEGGMLPLIIGRMLGYFPSFRVRTIQYFLQEARPDGKIPCHGIITFDLGRGTPVKTAVFLDHHLSRNKPLIKIGEMAIDLGFLDGLLIKGTMSYLAGFPRLAKYLVGIVHQNGGVVVEGNSAEDFYIGEVREGRSPKPYNGAEIVEYRHLGLSYADGMRIALFSPNGSSVALDPGTSVLNGGLFVFSDMESITRPLIGGSRTRFAVGDVIHLDLARPSGLLGSVAKDVRMMRVNDTLAAIEARVVRAREIVDMRLR